VETERESVTLITPAKGGKARVRTGQGEEIPCSNLPLYPPAVPGAVFAADVTREGGHGVKAVFKGWKKSWILCWQVWINRQGAGPRAYLPCFSSMSQLSWPAGDAERCKEKIWAGELRTRETAMKRIFGKWIDHGSGVLSWIVLKLKYHINKKTYGPNFIFDL
jgi:hypothetical protein